MKKKIDDENKLVVENGSQDECVADCLEFLGRVSITHNLKETQWRIIQQFFESGFNVYNLSGNKIIGSKMILSALMDFVDKVKFLDAEIYSIGEIPGIKPENLKAIRAIRNQILTAAVSTVLDEGGLPQCLRDKGGVFYKMALFGDSWLQIGMIEEDGFPLQFRVASLSDVYVDDSCVDVRDPVSGLSATEVCAIYSYSIGQFNNLYPQFKEKVVKGKIPRSSTWRKKLEKTWVQTVFQEADTIEVAHYWNLGEMSYRMFAGAACTPLIRYGEEDEAYPWVIKKTKEAYIPMIHFKFIPSSEGFYNYGLGHCLYDIAMLLAEVDNMALKHAKKNVNPINIVTVPKNQEAVVINKIREAQKMEAAGGIGVAIVGTDATNNGQVGIEPFITVPITQEWERLIERLETLVRQLGFNLNPIDQNDNATQMEILANEENTNKRIEQIMRFNASECKMIYKIAIDLMSKNIKKSDKTPLNLSLDIDGVDITELTLGKISEELRQNGDVYIQINDRDGKIPSKTMQRAEIAQIFPTLPPGSKAQFKAIAKNAKLNNQDISEDDLAPMAPPQPTQPPPGTNPPESPLQQFGQLTTTNNPIKQ